MSVGSANGKVNIYDLRNPKPLFTINHSYRLPIKKIKFHEHSQNIITVDKKLAKFSNMKTGKAFTNIETKHEINDFEAYPDSGMFMFACESEIMEIYMIPGVGPAPKWASFLENITEELEETKNYSVYEDYKFLTMNDLEQMGATTLIGTNFVKPYMHGYFMDWKLYKKLKSVTDPFAYDKYLEDRKQEKFKKLFGERIVLNRHNKVRVNSKLLEDNKTGQAVAEDNRFKTLFENKDFEIDFQSEHFKSSNPSRKKMNKEIDENLIDLDEKAKEVKVKNDMSYSGKIVNPEIIKLQEKLLSKKRQKIDKLYGNKPEEMEEALENRLGKEENEDEDEFDLLNKINKIQNKIERNSKNSKVKPKITQKNANDGKRILANRNKLALAKIR